MGRRGKALGIGLRVASGWVGKRCQDMCVCVPLVVTESRGSGADLPIQSNEAMAFRWMSGLINHLYLLRDDLPFPIGPR